MALAPETATSPLAQAPPDRQTLTLEQWAQQGLALLFSDRRLDPNEMRLLRAFFEEVQARAQAGGIGQGATPSPDQAAAQPPQSPMEQNASGAQDYGTVDGAVPTGEQP